MWFFLLCRASAALIDSCRLYPEFMAKKLGSAMEGREAACADGLAPDAQAERKRNPGTAVCPKHRPQIKKRFLFFCFGSIIFV